MAVIQAKDRAFFVCQRHQCLMSMTECRRLSHRKTDKDPNKNKDILPTKCPGCEQHKGIVKTYSMQEVMDRTYEPELAGLSPDKQMLPASKVELSGFESSIPTLLSKGKYSKVSIQTYDLIEKKFQKPLKELIEGWLKQDATRHHIAKYHLGVAVCTFDKLISRLSIEETSRLRIVINIAPRFRMADTRLCLTDACKDKIPGLPNFRAEMASVGVTESTTKLDDIDKAIKEAEFLQITEETRKSMMFVLEGFTQTEIALKVGISQNKVSLLYRCFITILRTEAVQRYTQLFCPTLLTQEQLLVITEGCPERQHLFNLINKLSIGMTNEK